MSVFKLFFKIICKNKTPLLIYLGIFLGISLLYANTNSDTQENLFKDSKSNIAIFNYDKGEIGTYLTSYLKEKNNIIPIADDTKDKQDALYYREVDYIITIPDSFSKNYLNNENPKIKTNSVPNSGQKFYIDKLTNQYLSKLSLYKQQFPNKSLNQLVALVKSDLSKQSTVSMLNTKSNSEVTNNLTRIFDQMAYGLFSVIILCISLISVSMNKSSISIRNNCSPISSRRFNLYYYISNGAFAIFSWVLFLLATMAFTRKNFFLDATPWLIFNSFIFLLTMIGISVFLSNLIRNMESLSAITNILVLGSCFASGVFVPQEFLSPIVLKISSFFPTYWFVKNNNIIANTTNFSGSNLDEFYFNVGVQLLFVLVFLIINLLIKKQKGGSKSK